MGEREVYDAAEHAITDAICFAKTAASTTLADGRQDAVTATWELCRSVPAFEACLREAGEEKFVEHVGDLLAGSGREVPSHAGHSTATWIEWVLDVIFTLSRGLKLTCRGYLVDDESVPFDFSVSEIVDHWDAVALHFERFADNTDASRVAACLVEECRIVERLSRQAVAGSHVKKAPEYVFRRKGELWEIQFDDERGELPDKAGMDAIRRMLGWGPSQTSEEALTLEDPTANVESAPRGIEQIDVEAIDGMIESVRSKLASISSKAEEEHLEERLDQLQAERQRRTNIHGHARVDGDGRLKAINRVHKAITRTKGAIDHIATKCPKLADYLSGIGRSGTEITFSPAARYDWNL